MGYLFQLLLLGMFKYRTIWEESVGELEKKNSKNPEKKEKYENPFQTPPKGYYYPSVF